MLPSDGTSQRSSPFQNISGSRQELFQGTLKKLAVRSTTSFLLTAQTEEHGDEDPTEHLPSTPSDGRYERYARRHFCPRLSSPIVSDSSKLKSRLFCKVLRGQGTFVAEQLAAFGLGAQRVKVVQFPESYGYEDFVYGLQART